LRDGFHPITLPTLGILMFIAAWTTVITTERESGYFDLK